MLYGNKFDFMGNSVPFLIKSFSVGDQYDSNVCQLEIKAESVASCLSLVYRLGTRGNGFPGSKQW